MISLALGGGALFATLQINSLAANDLRREFLSLGRGAVYVALSNATASSARGLAQGREPAADSTPVDRRRVEQALATLDDRVGSTFKSVWVQGEQCAVRRGAIEEQAFVYLLTDGTEKMLRIEGGQGASSAAWIGEQFTRAGDLVGHLVDVCGKPVEVVGTLRASRPLRDLADVSVDTSIFVTPSFARGLFLPMRVQGVMLWPQPEASALPESEAIQRAFAKQGLQARVVTPSALIEEQNHQGERLRLVLLCVAWLLALCGGAATVVNFRSGVSARRQEIAVRLAIGALPHEIMLQFMLEAVAAGLGGGLLAIVAGLFCTAIAAIAFQLPFSLLPLEGLFILLGTVAVAALASIAPALRASSVSPQLLLRGDWL